MKTKTAISIFLLLFLFSSTSYSQNTANTIVKKEETNKIKDSIKLSIYFANLDKYSFFSKKRDSYFDSIMMFYPTNAALWQQKAMTFFKQMKYEKGAAPLDSAVKYNRKEMLEYRAFMRCIFYKKYTESIADFSDVVKEKGELFVMDHPSSFYVSLCYMQLNNFDSAYFYMEKSIAFEQKTFNSKSITLMHSFYLGIIFYEQGKYDEAIDDFDKALLSYSKFSDAQYYKGLCLEQIGKIKEAIDIMNLSMLNFKSGYTINESNAVYEKYPYQIKEFYITNTIKKLNLLVKQ